MTIAMPSRSTALGDMGSEIGRGVAHAKDFHERLDHYDHLHASAPGSPVRGPAKVLNCALLFALTYDLLRLMALGS